MRPKGEGPAYVDWSWPKGETMSVHARIQRFARAIERLRTVGDPLHERLCAETPHMAPEVMSRGLNVSLAGWDEAGLTALWTEAQPHLQGAIRPSRATVILGGVLPPSHVQALAYPYLLGAELQVKAPQADSLFLSLFLAALDDPTVTEVQRSGLAEVLKRADAVVAVGGDESIRAIDLEFPVSTPYLGFGHRTAIAMVTAPARVREHATVSALARDVLTFDQLGCLSPREIWVLGTLQDAESLAESLALAFDGSPQRASLGVPVEAAIRLARETAQMEGHSVQGPSDLQWGVFVCEEGVWTGTPGGRHVVVRAVSDPSRFPEVLAPMARQLSAVSVAGAPFNDTVYDLLVHHGASRIVRAGELQAAPPTWPHDGRRPLAALCRWCGGLPR